MVRGARISVHVRIWTYKAICVGVELIAPPRSVELVQRVTTEGRRAGGIGRHPGGAKGLKAYNCGVPGIYLVFLFFSG